MRRVGLLLSGCGRYDGSDVQETVLLVLALRRRGLRPVYLAPDAEQRDVVDHSTGDTVDGAAPRRVLTEGARLIRGVIRDVAEIAPAEIDALVIPGGAGAVKNLCLPEEGGLGVGSLRPEIGRLLDALAERQAPVGVVGVAEVVLARHQDRAVGNAPAAVAPTEIIADGGRKTVFTPGFLATDDVTEVAAGIGKLVDELAGQLGMNARTEGKR